MAKFIPLVLLLGCPSVLCAACPTPAAAWREAENPSLLTNSIVMPPAFTVTAWFEADSFDGFSPILTCTGDFSSWTNGFGIFTTADGRLRAFARSIDEPSLSAPALDAGLPCHFAFVYSGSDASLYVNGVHASSVVFSSQSPLGACGPFWVGVPPDSKEYHAFDGVVADVRLYSHCLDRAAVGMEYASGRIALLKAAGKDVSRVDSDGDGMPDEWELRFGLNPCDSSDAAQDSDGDGEPNVNEYRLGRDPRIRPGTAARPLIKASTVSSP